ncbi:uncharacterized protein LOC133203493 [Saccostrea echinata]|uniref:uncharacterized protein LOC133203493 n=1 Tax=Saccostrea echinata TaxID=191078 RepID=UPI002A83FEBF|nr:uncharacterized protein LOC133203493 [Saccostrea echinata]
MPQCININMEKELNVSDTTDTKSCIRRSKMHIYNKTLEIDAFLQKRSSSDENSMISNLSCIIESNITTSSETCICQSLMTIPLSIDDKCNDYCTVIRVYVHSATKCICDACNENHMMVYFVKPQDIIQGRNMISVLGSLLGGIVFGLVFGTGLAVWILKTCKRNSRQDSSASPGPRVSYMTKNREPLDHHSYIGRPEQSVDNRIHDGEFPDYDNVLYG